MRPLANEGPPLLRANSVSGAAAHDLALFSKYQGCQPATQNELCKGKERKGGVFNTGERERKKRRVKTPKRRALAVPAAHVLLFVVVCITQVKQLENEKQKRTNNCPHHVCVVVVVVAFAFVLRRWAPASHHAAGNGGQNAVYGPSLKKGLVAALGPPQAPHARPLRGIESPQKNSPKRTKANTSCACLEERRACPHEAGGDYAQNGDRSCVMVEQRMRAGQSPTPTQPPRPRVVLPFPPSGASAHDRVVLLVLPGARLPDLHRFVP